MIRMLGEDVEIIERAPHKRVSLITQDVIGGLGYMNNITTIDDLAAIQEETLPLGTSTSVLVTAQAHHVLLQDPIGRGADAVVYRGQYGDSAAPVAVKVFEGGGSAAHRVRCREEIDLTLSLNSPRLVRGIDQGMMGESPFLVLEYMAGGTLDTYAAAQRPLAPSDIRDVGLQLCACLMALHAHGIIHRDIKPKNVLRDADGRLRLADFGIALRTGASPSLQTLPYMGTPAFIAPEQALNQPQSPATDVYAAGALLFWLATGSLPFAMRTAMAMSVAHVTQAPPSVRSVRPDLPETLDSIIWTCLQKDPGARYSDARMLHEDLSRLPIRVHRVDSPNKQALPNVTLPSITRSPVATNPKRSRGAESTRRPTLANGIRGQRELSSKRAKRRTVAASAIVTGACASFLAAQILHGIAVPRVAAPATVASRHTTAQALSSRAWSFAPVRGTPKGGLLTLYNPNRKSSVATIHTVTNSVAGSARVVVPPHGSRDVVLRIGIGKGGSLAATVTAERLLVAQRVVVTAGGTTSSYGIAVVPTKV